MQTSPGMLTPAQPPSERRSRLPAFVNRSRDDFSRLVRMRMFGKPRDGLEESAMRWAVTEGGSGGRRRRCGTGARRRARDRPSCRSAVLLCSHRGRRVRSTASGSQKAAPGHRRGPRPPSYPDGGRDGQLRSRGPMRSRYSATSPRSSSSSCRRDSTALRGYLVNRICVVPATCERDSF
jgi:hypothetical protein